ncbi:hypothetical protein [Stakelama tenebrarum]|uniref:DUF1795 domain-containing protein n=1 Tax=Stakelama tenebrarum TaxID=2711215 RepID=A0A6G6Y1Z1_9SPHN|nr:hypothetical protein [Sphingosinithalassobacter tenebrarum]QIG78942.1 hypothetical protein G5C33_03505 [Sphingosinithalassobacter tenebrarum]
MVFQSFALALLSFSQLAVQDLWAPVPAGWVADGEKTDALGRTRTLTIEGAPHDELRSEIKEMHLPSIGLFLTPEDMIDAAEERLQKDCAKPTRTMLADGGEDGPLIAKITCRDIAGTGIPLFLYLSVERESGALHSLQVIYMHVPDAAEDAFARTYLGVSE